MTPRHLFRSTLVALAGLALLAGCADQFVTNVPSGTPMWTGVTTEGPANVAGCGAVKVEVAIQPVDNATSDRVVGRAYNTTPAATRVGRWVEETHSWWVEGFAAANEVVSFELRQQGPWRSSLRPQSIWRGTVAGDVIDLSESGSPCSRSLQLRRA